VTEAEKDGSAKSIVKKYALFTAGAGLIPLPLVDMAAIAGLELKMIQEISKVYDVRFTKDIAKSIVTSVLGGYASEKVGVGAGASAVKSIPIVGQTVGMVSVPVFAAGITWSIGKVFIQHFAAGGTFLNFDPEQVRAHFNAQQAEA